MVDRVSLSITIGGDLAAALRDDLVARIQSEGLALDYDGEDFRAQDFPADGPLSLYAHEVAWGQADELEGFCVEQGLPFARWSGGCAAQFGPERAIFTGTGEVRLFAADEDDMVVIDLHRAEQLGSYEAIIAHFVAGDPAVPPLRFLP
ncbi:hypothetical protein [Sphingobium sp. ba1]|uniref:hypothetical protein n=1 Tax=Sphingobium sp. ba1 TaxID=1522072 RepID=UPI0005619431|nr:hypothetical protein [Sphingobium sp. ba1]